MKLLIKKLLKKTYLFCFFVISAITSSSKLLPMNMHMHMNNINLRLNQKPENISVYDWSKQRAAELVRESRLAILRLLGATEVGWEETKENLEFLFKNDIDQNEAKYRKQILPESTHGLIMSIIEHPLVQKELGITGISIQDGIVVAERAYADPIKFLCEDPDEPINSPEGSDGYNIIISPNIAFSGRYTDEELEAFIGHELGHIKCKHVPEKHCLITLYNEQLAKQETNVDQATFDEAMHDFDRAIEVQADIVGTFNNWILLETVENFWQDQANSLESNGMDSNSYASDIKHPPVAVRANYCHQMYDAMQRESEPKARPVNTNKNNRILNQTPKFTEKPRAIRPEKAKQEPEKPKTVKPEPAKQESVKPPRIAVPEPTKQAQIKSKQAKPKPVKNTQNANALEKTRRTKNVARINGKQEPAREQVQKNIVKNSSEPRQAQKIAVNPENEATQLHEDPALNQAAPEQTQKINNTQKEDPAEIFIKNLMNKITPKGALAIFGIFVAAYIILK